MEKNWRTDLYEIVMKAELQKAARAGIIDAELIAAAKDDVEKGLLPMIDEDFREEIHFACRNAYPIKWNKKLKTFTYEVDIKGNVVNPKKGYLAVLPPYEEWVKIVILSYLSRVEEIKIYSTHYDNEEEAARVRYARKIMEDYEGYIEYYDPFKEAMVDKEDVLRKVWSSIEDYLKEGEEKKE